MESYTNVRNLNEYILYYSDITELPQTPWAGRDCMKDLTIHP